MTEPQCPFCGQKLESVLRLVGAGGVEEAYVLCSKCGIRGERKLWQALIDTKKKLDIAVDFIKEMAAFYNSLNMSAPDTTVNWDVVAKLWADKNYKILEQINEIKGDK